jgi:corrinoid protein of di/trimethylamine methyltransferase
MDKEEEAIVHDLKKAIYEYNGELAFKSAQKAIKKKLDPLIGLNAMTEAIRDIGDSFGRGELWLPDLVGASDAMQSAIPVFDEELKKTGAQRKSLGVIVIGTVFGDIHSIGKTMVATLLTAAGFQVVDLGVNVKAEQFIHAIKNQNADMLAMSALMTTTCSEQEKVIAELKKEKIKESVKVMVGGAAVTEEFAENIGADGYDPTAPGAVFMAKKLLEIE